MVVGCGKYTGMKAYSVKALQGAIYRGRGWCSNCWRCRNGGGLPFRVSQWCEDINSVCLESWIKLVNPLKDKFFIENFSKRTNLFIYLFPMLLLHITPKNCHFPQYLHHYLYPKNHVLRFYCEHRTLYFTLSYWTEC